VEAPHPLLQPAVVGVHVVDVWRSGASGFGVPGAGKTWNLTRARRANAVIAAQHSSAGRVMAGPSAAAMLAASSRGRTASMVAPVRSRATMTGIRSADSPRLAAEKATGRSYRDLMHEMVIDAVGLTSTFYENWTYSVAVTNRLAHRYFDNPACADYQPNCKESWNLPLIGTDVRGMSTSWAQAAGGAVANARDVDRWMRAVFEGHVAPPKQQAEWMSLVSTKAGEPIADVSAEDPRGFSLGLSKALLGPMGPQWFYQGTTLGYRTLYVWLEKENLMITVQTSSQPADDADKLNDVVAAIHAIVRREAK
jgi:hypothetical protein